MRGKNKYLLLALFLGFSLVYSPYPASSLDTKCLTVAKQKDAADLWTPLDSDGKQYQVEWKLFDPEECLRSISSVSASFTSKGIVTKLQVTSSLARKDERAIVQLNVTIPAGLIESFPNRDLNKDEKEFLGGSDIELSILRDLGQGKSDQLNLAGDYSLWQFWADKFSKQKGTYANNCYAWMYSDAKSWNSGNFTNMSSEFKLSKSPSNGNPILNLNLDGGVANCIDLIYTGPISDIGYKYSSSFFSDEVLWPDWLVKLPFWSGPSSTYFKEILSSKSQVKIIAANDFDRWKITSAESYAVIEHESSISRTENGVKLTLNISRSSLEKAKKFKYLYLIYGTYYRNIYFAGSSSSGWQTTCSSYSNSTSCRSYYSAYREWAANTNIAFSANVKNLLVEDVLKTDETRQVEAAAELKKQQEAELKEKLEVERLSRQKQVCLQHNTDVVNLIQRLNDLKNRYPSKFKDYFDEEYSGMFAGHESNLLLSKKEYDCNVYGTYSYSSDVSWFNSKNEIWLTTLAWDKRSLDSLEKAIQPVIKITITCVKGKLVKKVIAVNPKCPTGYKKK